MSAFGFIGKFSAPGTGEIGVLGLELEHDFETGTKQGVVCLDRRPYWEGSATIFTLAMPATHERAAMTLTGVWTMREIRDGVGCYITVEGVRLQASTPALDETTDPADLDWGAIRSACDRRDWREAWGVVGTDHAGDATPGEVYLLSVARHKSATAAALHHWYLESLLLSGFGARDKTWKARFERIKGIAAWESSARAQYFKPTEKARRALSWFEIVNRGAVSTPHTADDFRQQYQGIPSPQLWADARADWAQRVRLYGRDNAGDELLNVLRQMERATQAADTTVRPTDMWIDEATLDALRQRSADDAMTRGNGGIAGVLNNPYLSAAAQRGEITGTVTIPPSASATIAVALERYASMTGNTMNVQAEGDRIVVTPRNANPAPRGPQTGRRRR